jgi:hypothetical protein
MLFEKLNVLQLLIYKEFKNYAQNGQSIKSLNETMI